MVTNAQELYDSIMTDDLMFALEPGTASRTKFAVLILQKMDRLDLESLDPEQRAKVEEVRGRASEFLL